MPWDGATPAARLRGMTAYLLTVLLVGLAVVRVTRLLTIDQLFEPWRSWWLDRYGAGNSFVYLLYCPWCLSVWIGAVAAGVVEWLAPAPLVHPAVSVVGLVSLYSLAAGVFCAHYGDGGDE